LSKIICSHCGAENEPGHKYCLKCFKPLTAKPTNPEPHELICSYCGAKNEPNSLYCNRCGFQLMDRCPICGALYPIEGAVVCTRCGTPLLAGKEFTEHAKRRIKKYSTLFYLYLSFLLLVSTFTVIWCVELKSYANLLLQYLSILILIVFILLLLIGLVNAYHNWSVAKKEYRKLRQWSKKI
jgi:ribosomal protein L40E